jgi:hypothetical protein
MLVRLWGEKEALYTDGGNVNHCSHVRSEYGGSSYNSAIPLLGMYPKESNQHTTEKPAHIVLFTIAKEWN